MIFMESIWFVITIIMALIAASGFFSLFEQALRISRKPRLQKEINSEADTGTRRRARYRRVLKAAENPGRYFAAARVWICILRTFAVLLAGLNMGHIIEMFPQHTAAAPLLAAAAALVCANLLLGDLIPRITARHAPERIASAALPLFEALNLPLRPFNFLARIAGKRLRAVLPSQPGMTEDELRLALMEGEKSGIVESKERTMVEGVFYLGDRPLGAFMTHRSEVQWLDIHYPPREIRVKVLEYRAQHCFPVTDGDLDAIIGAAYLEDIILDLASDTPQGLQAIMKKALFAPETMPALKAFELFRQGEANVLFVMDEYGGFTGIVSVRDLMEEIVGELTAAGHEEEPVSRQEDGTWLADGSLNIDDAEELLGLPGLASSGDYHTLAGFVLSLAGEVPRSGDSFSWQDCRFTVLDMDGNRIGKIAIKKKNETGNQNK